MCEECGCGLGGPVSISAGSDHGLERAHEHEHDHEHEHGHAHASAVPAGHSQVVAVERPLLEKNDRLAERNRGFFQAKKLLVLNMLSSPGSGKTTLIQQMALGLKGRLRLGVIVGDLATDNDAARLREAGIPVVQITTGTVCHLDAAMVSRAATQLDLDALDVLVIENVGNLVCPADYDLGENLRVVLLSTTEGEDKPLKYPPIFHSAQVVIITKADLAGAAGFEREKATVNLRRTSHHARFFEVSARTAQGMREWLDFVVKEREAVRR